MEFSLGESICVNMGREITTAIPGTNGARDESSAIRAEKDIRALVSASLVYRTEEFGSKVTSAVVTSQVMSTLHQSCDGSVRRSKLFFARCVRDKIVGKPNARPVPVRLLAYG